MSKLVSIEQKIMDKKLSLMKTRAMIAFVWLFALGMFVGAFMIHPGLWLMMVCVWGIYWIANSNQEEEDDSDDGLDG